MNRYVKLLSLVFAIPVALLLFGAWHAGARTAHTDQSKDNHSAAAPAPSNANPSPQIPATHESKKMLVAVLDFDATAVGTDVLGDKVDVGKGIAGLLAMQLAKEGTYIVVDSKMMSADLTEHNFSKSDRYNHEFAVNLGKRLGADRVIMGNVTLFGKESHERPVPQDEVIRRKIKARVAAEARIVDVATGEIVAVASGRGESKREGIFLTSGGSNWHDFRSGNFGFDSREFQETILGEAVNDMVLQLATALAADATRLTAPAAEITGLVVSGGGAEIVVNIGAKAGLKIGDQLRVERVVRDIPDPANGELSRLITTPLGVIRITEARETFSVATRISGDGEIKVGDHVKTAAHSP